MNDKHLAITTVPMQTWGALYEEEEALLIGTIFKDLDLPFFAAEKTEKPCCFKAIPKSDEEQEREQLMCRINAVSFFLDDLVLYLDTHCQDKDAAKLYVEKTKLRDQLKKEFAEKFYPLTRDCLVYCENDKECCWQEGPAPWEGACI